jgi:aryl-alcohol dehydrogenase-like predicted oxidoreductase
LVKEAGRVGVEHIDTAHVYTGGGSEKAIGRALSPAPEGCVIATKGGYAEGREELGAQIEESFLRLRTDDAAHPGHALAGSPERDLGALEIELSDAAFEALG